MIFSIKITSEDGEVIEIGKDGKEEEKDLIKDIVLHMDTVNEDSRNKSNAMLAKIQIIGAIDPEIADELLNLFNWSKDLEEKKWYRNIEIKVKTSMGSVFRTYVFPKVFIVDYLEFYTTESDTNKMVDQFQLYLTQKENNFKNIEAF